MWVFSKSSDNTTAGMGSLQTQKMAAGPMFQKKKKCRFTEELGPEAWSQIGLRDSGWEEGDRWEGV